MSTSVTSTVQSYPRLPYQAIARDILGPTYELSLVFVGEKRARSLNKKHRKKTYTPNVLSFPLGKKAGEIYITPARARIEAKHHNLSTRGYIGYLYIHGLLHLHGHHHGSAMERAETRYTKKYKLK